MIVEITSVGGEKHEVETSENATVGDFEQTLARAVPLGLCFTIVCRDDGTQLSDPAAALPLHKPLQYIDEDASCLCEAARRLLEGSRPSGASRWNPRFGACRKLGTFPSTEWKSYPRLPPSVGAYNNWRLIEYDVLELTIVDGAGRVSRLIGVISYGDGDIGVGRFGSFYLRPGFHEVAAFEDCGDSDTRLVVIDGTWYTDHATPFDRFDPDCSDADIMRIFQIKEPLGLHLLKAFEAAQHPFLQRRTC